MHILIIEDATEVAQLLSVILEAEPNVTATVKVDDFDTIFEDIDWSDVDGIVCDQFLGDCDGKDILAWVATQHPRIRRVMLTGDSEVKEDETNAHVVLIKPAGGPLIIKALGIDSD